MIAVFVISVLFLPSTVIFYLFIKAMNTTARTMQRQQRRSRNNTYVVKDRTGNGQSRKWEL